MRQKNITVYERYLINSVAGTIYAMSPLYQPRNIESIMNKVRDKFREVAYNINEWYTYNIDEKNFYKFIETMMKSIPEFRELNLSYNEYIKNISVDDENRPKYSFSSIYDKYTSESWKSDFIDLDACVRNIVNMYYDLIDSNEDCYCCKNNNNGSLYEDVNSTICLECSVNKSNKYSPRNSVMSDYNKVCMFSCFKNNGICCDDCIESLTCEHVCDSHSDICNQYVDNESKMMDQQ